MSFPEDGPQIVLDGSSSNGLGDLSKVFSALSLSTEQKIPSQMNRLIASVQSQFSVFIQKNSELQKELTSLKEQQIHIAVLHQGQLDSARKEIEQSRQEVKQLIAQQTIEIQKVLKESQDQVEVMKKEVEAARLETERLNKLIIEEGKQTKDTNRMQTWCLEISHADMAVSPSPANWYPHCRGWVEQFQALIDRRRNRKIDLIANPDEQNADTKRLQELASEVMNLFARRSQFPKPMIDIGQRVQAHMLTLVAERYSSPT